jgi:uncharacterized protein YebE (UPF0316 family)
MTDFLSFFSGFDYLNWILLPLMIFLARIIDVSIGTLRVMFISRGLHNIAPFLGFIEVFVWIVAIGQIMQNMHNIMAYIAYAGGFAMGTFIGMKIERLLSLGMSIVRIITKSDADLLVEFLKSKNYGLTVVDAEGSRGKVKLIFMVLKRKEIPNVLEILKKHQPKAFYTIEDVRYASEGVYPAAKPATGFLGRWRLGK